MCYFSRRTINVKSRRWLLIQKEPRTGLAHVGRGTDIANPQSKACLTETDGVPLICSKFNRADEAAVSCSKLDGAMAYVKTVVLH